jgi:transmembrane sensor
MMDNNISDRLKDNIISYFTGDLNQSQADELIKWLAKSNENIQYFNKLKDFWQATAIIGKHEFDSTKGLAIVRNKTKENGLRPFPEKKIKSNYSLLLKIAAAAFVIIILGIGTYYLFNKSESITTSNVFFEAHAPLGSRASITLTEGTQVWLNAGTTLRYNNNYGFTNRDVYLEGEAFFAVTKNKQLPFIVNTSDLCITALGTIFNVKSYKGENIIETTLEEGRLRIDQLVPKDYTKKIEPIYLKPSQNAVFFKQKRTIKVTDQNIPDDQNKNNIQENFKVLPIKITTVKDTRLYTSWKDNRWIFKNEKLSSLAPKLERRYDIKIVFEDSALLDYAFTGTLKDESIEQVLAAIRFTAPIRFEVNYKQVKLYVDEQLKRRYKDLLKPN